MAREFIVPKQIISGTAALEMAQESFSKLGKKALIVTDSVMVQLGNCKKVEDAIVSAGLSYSVFAEVNGEPTDVMINAGLAQYKAESCDFLVAVGGGSPIDAMKAIGSLSNHDGKIADYMGTIIDVPMPAMVAIPTTAGTGSEATQFTIITDTENDVKMLLKGKCLMPSLAVIDPQFTMTAPAKITAATGLDALCHAIEAFTSAKAQTMSDTFAKSAVRRIFTALPKVYKNGQDEQARIEMSVAALEAGIAFNNASVTLIHGMSRPIGAMFHVAHGLSNAMLMKECLAFAKEGAQERFCELGRIIRVTRPEDTEVEAAEKFLNAVNALVDELDTPTLAEFGVDRDTFFAAIPKMAHDAMESGSPQNTLRPMTEADIEQLYKNLW